MVSEGPKMENWQITHINKNLPDLIKLTKCTTTLKAHLKAKNVISDEEEQRLVRPTFICLLCLQISINHSKHLKHQTIV